MENKGSFAENYSGSLLISHPRLLDPNFRRTVVLLSAHSREDGAVGVILNRPTNKVLGEIEDEFAFGSLARVPIYLGGTGGLQPNPARGLDLVQGRVLL